VIDDQKKPLRTHGSRRNHIFLSVLCALCSFFFVVRGSGAPQAPPRTVRFVFTSDAHYGLTRPRFRGQHDVDAHVVNAALVDAINRVGPLDFVAEGGDVANREEETEAGVIQSAAASWTQFSADYIGGLTVKTASGRKAPPDDDVVAAEDDSHVQLQQRPRAVLTHAGRHPLRLHHDLAGLGRPCLARERHQAG
jgi:hypothetical protein